MALLSNAEQGIPTMATPAANREELVVVMVGSEGADEEKQPEATKAKRNSESSLATSQSTQSRTGSGTLPVARIGNQQAVPKKGRARRAMELGNRVCCRFPLACMIFWGLVYPALCAALLLTAGIPLFQLRPLEDISQSSTQASTQLNALVELVANLKLAQAGEAADALGRRRRRRRILADEEGAGEYEPSVQTSLAVLYLFYDAHQSPQNQGRDVLDLVPAIREFESGLIPDTLCIPLSDSQRNAYASVGIFPNSSSLPRCTTTAPQYSSVVSYFFASQFMRGSSAKVYISDGLGQTQRSRENVFDQWTREQVYAFLPQSFFNNANNASTLVERAVPSTRSTFVIQASGLDGQQTINDQLTTFLKKTLLPELRKRAQHAQDANGLVVSWENADIVDEELANTVEHDSFMVLASVAIVTVLLWALLDQSLFLCLMALYSLTLAFLLAYSVFTVVLGIHEMFLMNFLALYVIFGIGSDAMFILADAMHMNRFRAPSATTTNNDNVSDLDDDASEFEQTGWFRPFLGGTQAVLVTTSTTAVSFFSSAFSPVIALKEWCIFMGLVVDSSIPVFFDQSHNLGRVFALREQFDSVLVSSLTSSAPPGSSGGGNGGSGGFIQCEDGYVLNNAQTKCVNLTSAPTRLVTASPSEFMWIVASPTTFPTSPQPTQRPTSNSPSQSPTLRPTFSPSREPTTQAPVTTRPTSSRPTTKLPTAKPVRPSTPAPVVPSSPTPPLPPSSQSPSHSPSRATMLPSQSPTRAPTSQSPTSQPSSSPTRAPTSTSPTLRPSAIPSASPTRRPSTRTPTRQPNSPAPTRQPAFATLDACPSNALDTSCSGNGLCNSGPKTCTCFPGFSGVDCSQAAKAELPDSKVETVYMTFGMNANTGKLLEAPDEFDVSGVAEQEAMLGVCALFCLQKFNQTTLLPGNSRCAQPPFTTYDYSALNASALFGPIARHMDFDELRIRRLSECGFGDFVAYVTLVKGAEFPIRNATLFYELAGEFVGFVPAIKFWYVNFVTDPWNEVRLLRLKVYTTFSKDNNQAMDTNVAYEAWERVMDEITWQFEEFGLRINRGVQTCESWARSSTEVALVQGLQNSWILTFAVTIVAVIIHTRSVLMSVLTAISLAGTVFLVCLVLFEGLKWSFGILEIVQLSLVVGLAVDYYAHMCNAWVHTPPFRVASPSVPISDAANERLLRVFDKVAMSISSSMVTTTAVCLVLLTCYLLPFQQFGIVITLTVFLSFLLSFLFLGPLLALTMEWTHGIARVCCSASSSPASQARSSSI